MVHRSNATPVKLSIILLSDKNGRYFIVSIFIYSFNNVVNTKGTYSSTQVTIKAGKQEKTSKIATETPHPIFDESFVFLLSSKIDEIKIKIKDVDTEEEMGTVKLDFTDLAQNPMERKIIPINDELNMTATLSANIKYS